MFSGAAAPQPPSYGGNPQAMWGWGSGCSDPYQQQLLQASEKQVIYNQMAAMANYLPGLVAGVVPKKPKVLANEPAEFRWLKNRVNEILWHPEALPVS